MTDKNLIFEAPFMNDVCLNKFGVHSMVGPCESCRFLHCFIGLLGSRRSANIASATTTMVTGSETVPLSVSIADMLDIWNVLVAKVCETNAGINPMERVW